MSNSALVSYTKYSPNHSGRRNQKIAKVTVHYMAGDLSVETCGNVFAPKSRQASSNYGVDSSGRVGLYVDEANRAWTTASSWNDNRAVTIEVANVDASGRFSDAAWGKLVELTADICRRNGIKSLYYDGRNGTLTRHCDFSATACPGQWFKDNTQRFCDAVNAAIGGKAPVTPGPSGLDLGDDSWWGRKFNLAMQSQLGTPQDGVITGQSKYNRRFFWAVDDGAVQYQGNGDSQMVRALQRKVGATVDGFMGKETISKHQLWLMGLGYSVGPSGADGYCGNDTNRAVAQALRDGRYR